ncbi:MAG: hypothetical protein J6L70_00465 [Alphaproteobacteria bacterium]|nr:hypothetical protein [Alphaproteobacteria bacterium]
MKKIYYALLGGFSIIASNNALAAIANGELCLNNSQCESGICSRESATSLARCMPGRAAGETCHMSLDAASVYYDANIPCADGLICSYSSCVSAESLAGDCPEYHIALRDSPDLIIADTCPSGTTEIADDILSCVAGSNLYQSCYLFVPTGYSLSDSTGQYSFTDACPWE